MKPPSALSNVFYFVQIISLTNLGFLFLGQQPPASRLLAPSPVGGRGGVKPPPAVGVAAGRYHSVFWTDDAVYTWGLNAGQLGHIKVNLFCLIQSQYIVFTF